MVYANLIRRTFKRTPIVLGGIEASLRRLAHYDYWADKLKRSILLDSNADLVSYGMGKHSIVEIADALAAGLAIEDLTFINGTAYRARSLEHVYDAVTLPSFPEMQADPLAYARSFNVQYENSDPFTGKRLVEPYSCLLYTSASPPTARCPSGVLRGRLSLLCGPPLITMCGFLTTGDPCALRLKGL